MGVMIIEIELKEERRLILRLIKNIMILEKVFALKTQKATRHLIKILYRLYVQSTDGK